MTLADTLHRYSDDDEWSTEYVQRSGELAALGANSLHPFRMQPAEDMIRGWEYTLEEIQAACMIQAVSLVRFMDTQGDKHDMQKRVENDDFDPLSVGIIGWAALTYMTMDMSVWLLDITEDLFKDKDEWVTALANITTYHGSQFVKVDPDCFKEFTKEDSTEEDKAGDKE